MYVAPDAPPATLSILVRGGKIVFVADPPEVRRQAPRARAIDLSGRFVLPGLTDAHGHLEGLGHSLEVADLRGARDAAEAARRIAAKASALPSAVWGQGRGWDQNPWPGSVFPDARDLDAVLPDRPATAGRVDGHAIWVTAEGLLKYEDDLLAIGAEWLLPGLRSMALDPSLGSDIAIDAYRRTYGRDPAGLSRYGW